MKIKMISCAVTNEGLAYNYGITLTVGKDIDEAKAESFVNSKLAVLISEFTEEKEEVPEKPESVEKPKRKRKKKGDSDEV